MRILFFIFLLLIEISFSSGVSEDIPGPRWLTAKSGVIFPEAEALHAKFSTDSEARFTHDPHLLPKIKGVFGHVQTVFSDTADLIAPFEEVLGHFVAAKALTWDVQTLIHLALARRLDDTPFPEVLGEFEETAEVLMLLEVLPKISSPVEAQIFTAQLTKRLREFNSLPALVVFSDQSSVMGVHTLLQSFVVHEVAPVVISLKGGTVHGGLVQGSFATAFHDFLHGTQYANVILSTPFADKMLPQVKAHVATLKPSNPESVMEIVQAHLMLHEAIVAFKGGRGKALDRLGPLKQITLFQARSLLMDLDGRKKEFLDEQYTQTYFADKIIEALTDEKDEFSYLSYLRTFRVLGEGEMVGREDVEVETTPTTIRIVCAKLGMDGTFDVQWEVAESKGINTRMNYQIHVSPNVFGGEMEESIPIGIWLFDGYFFIPDPKISRQNMSDYAWLGKQLGFVEAGRNLKENPLSDVEMLDLVTRIMAEDTPLLRLDPSAAG